MSRICPLILALTVSLVAGCSKDAPTPPAVDAVQALTTAIAAELVAADGLIAGGAAVDATLGRQADKLRGARVDRRLPAGEIDPDAMRDALTAYAKMHGLGNVDLKLGTVAPGPEVPARQPGGEAYPYETAQVIGTVPISITVQGVDPKRLQTFFEAMKKLQVPLMVLPTLLVGDARATYSGSVYYRRGLARLERVHPVPALADWARTLEVPLPTDAAALKSLVSMHAQLNSKSNAIVAILAKRDQVARQARVLQFLRTQGKVVEEQKAPKTLKAPPTGATAPAVPTSGKAP